MTTTQSFTIGQAVRVIWNDSPFYGRTGFVRWLSDDASVCYLSEIGDGRCGFRSADLEAVPGRRLWPEPSHVTG